ncbi:MAG: SusC/RagA family TonB-linked outer membrane protein [Chitinophagaceae bacterium]|nr:MAG: SusC/RagA family TonB-linked outer membrane protein [Chitinophagaceae bacterium]
MQQESFCQFSPLFPPLKTLLRCLQAGISKPIIHGMKLLAVFVTIFCLHVSAKTEAQQVTLNLANVTLEKVFEEIQKQTSYNFFFQEDALAKANKVTVKVKNATVKSVLDFCFKDQPFTFEILDKSIVVKQKEEIPIPKSKIPPITITGKVVNEKGEPIAGASIRVKGSTIGTSTDNNGEFSLSKIDGPITLIISGTETQPQEIVISESGPVTIQLTTKVKEFDQVVFIAYGTTTKRLTTGNITTVKASEIGKQPVSNPLLALQARVPGLFITQNTGIAGGGITVRVQGQNSIGSGNDPLYVVDGIPINSQLPSTGLGLVLGNSGNVAIGSPPAAGNPLNYLNPLDIESISILKDADATAIYGSRAANGAILITTKRGKIGKAKFDIDLQQGWGKVTRRMEMLNTRQYLDMRYEAYALDGIDWRDPNQVANDLKVWDTTHYTDWQKQLIGGTAAFSNFNASLSGGSETVQYLVSGTYNKQTTVFPLPKNFADQKGAFLISLNTTSPNQKLKTRFSANFMVDNNRLPSADITEFAVLAEPNAPPLYLPEGELNWELNEAGSATIINPLVGKYAFYENKTNNLITNARVGYEVIPGLEIGSSFGFTQMQTRDYSPTPLLAIRPNWRNTVEQNSAVYGNRNISSWIIEPQVNYSRYISKGKIDILAGSTFHENKANGGSIYGVGYSNDQVLGDWLSATNIFANSSFSTQYRYNAFFGRIGFTWDEKYIINLTGRRDGSSRFGEANRFHNFGSAGVAWIFSNEKIIKRNNSVISFGKLRASYGTTGNDQIADYLYLSRYFPVPNVQVPYQSSAAISGGLPPNPHLQWEKTNKFQTGIDLGFLKNRLLLNATYSRNISSNQLLSYSLPTITGFANIPFVNFPATVENTTWELSLNTINIQSTQVTWETGINLTIPRNRLTEFPDLDNSTYKNQLIIGQPLNFTRAYKFQQVDPATGLYTFDAKQDPFNPDYLEDAKIFINTNPRIYGGFHNKVTYKGFELDFLFQFVKQVAYNMRFGSNFNTLPGNFFRGSSNQPADIINRWHKQGDIAPVGKVSTLEWDNVYLNTTYAMGSDAAFSDASYLRLKNLSLSWNLPPALQRKLGIGNGQLYIHAQNILTITSYKGLDPENQNIYTLPPLKIISAGVHFQL